MEGLNHKSPKFKKFPCGIWGEMNGCRGKRQGFGKNPKYRYKVIVLEVIYEGATQNAREAILKYRGHEWRMNDAGTVYRIGYGPHGTHKTVTLCTDAFLTVLLHTWKERGNK